MEVDQLYDRGNTSFRIESGQNVFSLMDDLRREHGDLGCHIWAGGGRVYMTLYIKNFKRPK